MLAFGRARVNWSGTPQKLYDSVTRIVGPRLRTANWPPTVAKFGSRITQNRTPASPARTCRRLRAEARRSYCDLTSRQRSDSRLINQRTDPLREFRFYHVYLLVLRHALTINV